MKCYFCDDELTKVNETEEHIILNALGGKLKSRRLICKDCNSKLGSSIDNQLAEQLKPIATLLNVKRDRGTPQNVKAKHESKEILIEPGGKMTLARAYHSIENDGQVHIEAPSVGDAKRVLSGLKRKYPELNIDQLLEKAERRETYLPSVTLSMNFGGEEIKRAILKMAVNYYILNGGNENIIKHLLPFIEGKSQNAEVYYFYPRVEVFNKGKEEILHSLILKADPQIKQLYVFIELFNEFKFVVFLSRDYVGDEIYHSYHYNVVTNEIVNYETQINILPKYLKKFCIDVIDVGKFNERIRVLFQQIDNVMVNKRIHEITQSAMDEMMKKYPKEENPVMSSEMISFLAKKVSEKFVSSFQHRLHVPETDFG
jgi:hypothetical protein